MKPDEFRESLLIPYFSAEYFFLFFFGICPRNEVELCVCKGAKNGNWRSSVPRAFSDSAQSVPIRLTDFDRNNQTQRHFSSTFYSIDF